MSVTFNRTKLELKLYTILQKNTRIHAFNRTSAIVIGTGIETNLLKR